MKKFILIITTLFLVFFTSNCVQPKIIKKAVMIPMSDGAELSSNITTPNHGDKWSVVIVRTSYGKGNKEDDSREYWANEG